MLHPFCCTQFLVTSVAKSKSLRLNFKNSLVLFKTYFVRPSSLLKLQRKRTSYHKLKEISETFQSINCNGFTIPHLNKPKGT